jgi:hypothetical protein
VVVQLGRRPDSVRGYDERTASRSLGALATHEFRTPLFSPSQQLTSLLSGWDGSGNLADGDALQFDGFWDYGFVRDNRVPPHAPNGTTLWCSLHARLLHRFPGRKRLAASSRPRPNSSRKPADLLRSGGRLNAMGSNRMSIMSSKAGPGRRR